MTFFMHTANGTLGDASFWSFGLVTSGSVSEAAAETAWANAVVAFFTDTNVKTYYHPDFTLTQTASSTASPTFHQTTKTVTSHSTVGTSTGVQLPSRLTPLISLYTAQATRWGRGRMKLPSPTSTVLATTGTGELDATVRANIASAASTWLAALVTAGLTPVLVHRKVTLTGPAQYSTTQYASGLVWGRLDTLRRRGDKIVPASSPVSI